VEFQRSIDTLSNEFGQRGWHTPLCEQLGGLKLPKLARDLPKIDLHRHLEGSIEPEVLIRLARKHGIPLPSYAVDELRPHIQITENDKTLLDFLQKFKLIGRIFSNEEVVRDLTYYVVEQAARDNLKYLELRFSPTYMAAAHGLDVDLVMKAVLRGVNQASRDYSLPVNLILIVERQNGLGPAWVVEGLAEKYSQKSKRVVALDLANDEANFPPGPFEPVFRKAKAANIKIDTHASEAAGPENTRTAIECLQADRIGHGVRIREDSEVVELIKNTKTPLELCITSNLQTGAVTDIDDHPMREYFDQGLRVTLNTDDPGVSGISLSDELALAMRHFDFSFAELLEITKNSVDAGFMSGKEKEKVWRAIERGFRKTADRYLPE
jgi:adenosine deaminase